MNELTKVPTWRIERDSNPCIGVDLGEAAGARAPPIIELVGQGYLFAPPIIQVRIFENIETTSEQRQGT